MSEPRDDGDANARAEAHQRAYEEFLSPGPLPPGADPEAAAAHLLAALEREIGVRIAEPPRAQPAGVRVNPFAWLWAPRARPAFALAAVVVAALATWTILAPPGREPEPLLRGPAGAVSPGTAPGGLTATPLGADRVRLTWTAAPGATSYAVVFLGADLDEVARVEPVAATELVLDSAALPAGLAPGDAVLWRVTASAGRDEIARSATSPLTLP